MTGPARAGLFIYAVNLEQVAKFYQSIASMEVLHQREDLIVLQSTDFQLLIHKIPDDIAKNITIEVPPRRREDSALKFFFTVDSLENARDSGALLGGKIYLETWDGPGFTACNGIDPEGNVFQIRENAQ